VSPYFGKGIHSRRAWCCLFVEYLHIQLLWARREEGSLHRYEQSVNLERGDNVKRFSFPLANPTREVSSRELLICSIQSKSKESELNGVDNCCLSGIIPTKDHCHAWKGANLQTPWESCKVINSQGRQLRQILPLKNYFRLHPSPPLVETSGPYLSRVGSECTHRFSEAAA